jgi:hypothetical protein
MASIPLGSAAGLKFTADRTAFIGFVLLWAVSTIGAIVLLEPPPLEAIAGGFIFTVLHFFSELWHQFGHAVAARRTGYPMIGVRFWWILAASIYPKDEPELPGSTHIRRAIGGPIASFILAGIAWVLTMIVGGIKEYTLLLWVFPLFFLDNFFFFTIGSFLPLGFTDGSTILRWKGK